MSEMWRYYDPTQHFDTAIYLPVFCFSRVVVLLVWWRQSFVSSLN